MLATWRATVVGLMNSRSAISRLLAPAASRRRISQLAPGQPGGAAIPPPVARGPIGAAGTASASAIASSRDSARPAAQRGGERLGAQRVAQRVQDGREVGDARSATCGVAISSRSAAAAPNSRAAGSELPGGGAHPRQPLQRRR